MNSRDKIAVAVVLVILIISGGLYALYQTRSSSNIDEAPALETPSEVSAPSLEKQKEIVFSEQMVVQKDQYAVDGSAWTPLACSDNPEAPVELGYFQSGDSKIRLLCYEDYLAGPYLEFEDSGGKNKIIKIALKDADAGEMWDTRTWIKRDPESQNLVLETVRLSSFEDPESEEMFDCNVTLNAFVWNPQSREFEKYQPAEDFDLTEFSPPIHVSKVCLDEKGYWKGMSL